MRKKQRFTVLRVVLQCVILVFPYHTHLPFLFLYIIISILSSIKTFSVSLLVNGHVCRVKVQCINMLVFPVTL